MISGSGASTISKLGPSAKKVPPEDTPFWIATRLAYYYAADTPRGWDNTDFSESQGVSFLVDKNPKMKKYMLESTAEVMARAVAIPCLAATDKTLEEPPEHMGPLPDKFQCIMLTGGVELDVFN